jgi:hypothetical protein
MPSVELDADKFNALLPEFSSYSAAELAGYFSRAELYIENGAAATIPDPPRESILYLTMAHLMTLYKDGRGGSVGRISSASQGSVSVSFDFPAAAAGGNGIWWNQTQYGAEVWAVTAKYRTFKWVR